VLLENSTVIHNVNVNAGASYLGNMSFTTGSFTYVGTGAGNVQFLITSANPGSGRFAGAVDNFSVSAILEPSTYAAIFGALALGAAAYRRLYHPRT
jgi:hypothetical protein